MSDPLIGAHLGHFQIQRLLAEGGMGLIYHATHTVIGKQAAVKVLTEKYSRDRNMIKRLHREARAVNRIGHPNIIDIFDFGQTPDGREYFVMEYVPGKNLAAIIMERRRLPWSFIKPVMHQTLDALATIHDLGFIHRDIKPENLLVVEQEGGHIWVKLLDFGIVRSTGLGPDGERLTRAGSVMGTPEYVAPEQIRGKETDGRVDLYAMGIMLFEMIMGRRPYESNKMISLLMSHLRDPIPPMDDLPPALGLPEFVPQVVRKAMAKVPEQRFSTAREFATALGFDVSAGGTPSGIHPPLSDEVREAIEAQMQASVEPAAVAHRSGDLSQPTVPRVTAAGAVPGHYTTTEATPRRGSRVAAAVPLVLILLSAAAIGLYYFDGPRSRLAALLGSADRPADAGLGSVKPHKDKSELNIDIPSLYERTRRVLREGSLSPQPEVRRVSVKGVGELKDTEAGALLASVLRKDPDPQVQAAAASALSKLGSPDVVGPLKDARDRSDAVTRVWIDEALMRLGQEEGRRNLREALQAEDKAVRFQAALALGDAGDPAAVKVLKALASDTAVLNTQRVVAILGTLSRLGHARAYRSLRQAMKSADPAVKLGAAEALARLGDEEAVGTLTHVLSVGQDRPARLLAAKILASLGDYSGLPALKKAAEHDTERLRRLAAEGLGSMTDRAALQPLATLLGDPKWPVKAAAAESLARILALMPTALVKRSQDWLRTALANRDWSVRHTAAGISSDMDPELAVSLLGWALQDEDPRVRSAAVDGLGRLHNEQAVPLLRRALVDDSPDVRRRAANALRGVESKDVTEALHAAVQDQSPAVGATAAGALLAKGDTTYLEDLKKASTKGKPAVRAAAIAALANWKDPQADALLRGALSDRVQEVRLAAALGLASRGTRSPEAAQELRKEVAGGGPRTETALAAMAKLDMDVSKETNSLSKSSSPTKRAHAMRAARLLPPARALPLLRGGIRDDAQAVRLAAVDSLAELAPKHGGAGPLLEQMRQDPDPAVRARASLGLASLRRARSAPYMGKVKPVEPPPSPKEPEKAAPPRIRREDRTSPLFVEDTDRSRLYKYHMVKASLAVSQGKYETALGHLKKAAERHNAPPVMFDRGLVHFKLAVKHLSSNKNATRKHLRLSRAFFSQYLRKAPDGKQAPKARQGLADVKRLSAQVR